MTTLQDAPTGSTATRGDRSRWVALVVLCAGMLMIVLDVTVVNVALPTIQRNLGFSQSSLAWVVNAYLITFGGLLLLSGRLGDLIGRKRIFMIGLTLFTVASLACGLADSQAVLVISRFVQGIGGAMTSAVILGMIVTMFPEPAEQAKAIGVYSFVASAGGTIGLLAGGVITQAINWHWIFFLNLPIALVTGALAWTRIEDDEGVGFADGADVLGGTLLVSSLMVGVYAIVEVSRYHWVSAHTLGFGAASAALLVAFVRREARTPQPLIPLRIFRSRKISGANIIQALVVPGMFGMFFLVALYLQQVRSYDTLHVGLAFLPATLLMGILSLRYSARLTLRFGTRATLLPGLVMIVGSLLLLARLPVHGHYVTDLVPPLVLLGIGAGLSFPSLMALAMADATPADSGLASGLVSTSAQVGAALGLAVLATLASTHTSSLEAGGTSHASALTGGYHLAFLVGAGLATAAVAVAVAVLQGAPAPATHHAEVPEPSYAAVD